MTIEQFELELLALLCKATDTGLEAEDICAILEYLSAHGWEE